MSTAKNCPVMVNNVMTAKKIFGPDMLSLKGKSTRQKPKPAKQDLLETPQETLSKHHNIESCVDTMLMSKCSMLTVTNQTIKFWSLIPVNTKQHSECCCALDLIF